jgi:bacterioferritin-associated ferredoxin
VRQGAASTEDVGDVCGAGTACGGCEPLVAALVETELARSVHPNATVQRAERHLPTLPPGISLDEYCVA